MKVHKTCLLFGNVEQLVAGLELQEMTETLLPRPHKYILDDCYPLNRDQNIKLMLQVKKRWENQITFLHNDKNLGIHKSFNLLFEFLAPAEEDIIITVAPDTVPIDRGWDEAMVEVLTGDSTVAYVGTSSYATKSTPGVIWHKKMVGKVSYSVGDGPAMSHATAWRASFLRKVGGFHQPMNYYGHLEAEMWIRARSLGMTHAYLDHHEEDFRLEAYHDDVYRRYKLDHAHKQTFPGSFAEYLEKGFK